MALTVKEFARRAFRIITANSPTVPLHGDDFQNALLTLNQLLSEYASDGFYLTIAKTVQYTLPTGQDVVVTGPAGATPTPDITEGRLATLERAWLMLDGTDYPLIPKSPKVFESAYKYDPLLGLPRFSIVFPETETTSIRLYPGPSQEYTLNLRGKFSVTTLTATDDLTGVLPDYFERFALLAVARDLSIFTGRMDAWTDKLEARYEEARMKMANASENDLSIVGDDDSLLNGAWRVKAGV